MRTRTLTVVGLAALLLLAGCTGQTLSSNGTPGAEAPTNSTIAVSGAGSASASPGQAVVRVGVRATDTDPVDARQQLAENTSRLRAALEELGIEADQITTTRYGLGREHRRPRREGGEPRVRYRAFHGFEITVRDTGRVGEVIDAAVRNGANEVDDVRFTLTSEQRRGLEADARRAAVADARQKARQLAAASNLTITGVKVVRTTSVGEPRQAEGALTPTPTATPSDGADTDVESGQVTVVSRVHIVFTAESAGS